MISTAPRHKVVSSSFLFGNQTKFRGRRGSKRSDTARLLVTTSGTTIPGSRACASPRRQFGAPACELFLPPHLRGFAMSTGGGGGWRALNLRRTRLAGGESEAVRPAGRQNGSAEDRGAADGPVLGEQAIWGLEVMGAQPAVRRLTSENQPIPLDTVTPARAPALPGPRTFAPS